MNNHTVKNRRRTKKVQINYTKIRTTFLANKIYINFISKLLKLKNFIVLLNPPPPPPPPSMLPFDLCEIIRKPNVSFSLICALTCTYQGVRYVRFSDVFRWIKREIWRKGLANLEKLRILSIGSTLPENQVLKRELINRHIKNRI